LLEGCEFGILIVKLRLGIGELLLQEARCTFGGLFTPTEILAYEERRDLATNLLRCARILCLEGDKEAWRPIRHRARGGDGLDPDRLLRHFDAVVHGILAAGEQVELLDDRLNT
jgi:hypothetical protein